MGAEGEVGTELGGVEPVESDSSESLSSSETSGLEVPGSIRLGTMEVLFDDKVRYGANARSQTDTDDEEYRFRTRW